MSEEIENQIEKPENTPTIPTDEERELASVEKYARANPNNLPDQFKGDPDKFIASYKELRKSYTKASQELSKIKKQQEQPQADVDPQPEENEPPISDKLAIPAQPEPTENDAEWDELGLELQKSGDLSAQTRQKIKAKYKVPDHIINQYVDGWKQRSIALVQEAAKMVGGNDELQKIIKYASESLSDQERQVVNQQLSSPAWKTTLLGLHARMSKETNNNPINKEPKKSVPQTTSMVATQEIEPFFNRKDMTAHIRDKRYGVDRKYTEWVQARIRASGDSKWLNG